MGFGKLSVIFGENYIIAGIQEDAGFEDVRVEDCFSSFLHSSGDFFGKGGFNAGDLQLALHPGFIEISSRQLLQLKKKLLL